MSRVSENSSSNSINFSLGKTKSKLEDLQIKGSNLKRIQKPSDDPIGNVELLAIRSLKADAQQYTKNASFAKTQLEFTENAISDLTELVLKAKELAIQQASEIYSPEQRKSVAEEINQIRLQALGIANRRLGNKYIFGGHKTLTKPFDEQGIYKGDNGKSYTEVGKDFFIETNVSGRQLFYNPSIDHAQDYFELKPDSPVLQQNPEKVDYEKLERTLASTEGIQQRHIEYENKGVESNLFTDLETLRNALYTDNPDIIQDMLDKLDTRHEFLVKSRTRIGSLINSIDNNQNQTERDLIIKDAYKSKIEDADVAELFSEMNKQQNILNATYKSSSQLLNNSLLDFLR